LSGRRARIDVSLDGIAISRSEADATRYGVSPRIHVDWDDVSGAEVQTTRKGRPVIRLHVAGAATPVHQRDDPHAIKLPRKQAGIAHQLVAQINDEVSGRRRWRQHR
jgi:hypothetical protein